MPPDIRTISASWRSGWDALSPSWRQALVRLGLVLVALLALFAGDWTAMAGQWWNSSTYNHVLLVPAIVAWLVHQRARELLRLEPEGWWPGLVLAGMALFLWMLGVFGGLATARQLGVVLLLIATVLALLGPRVGAGLMFPLGYLLFLVPFGDELVPALQMLTAAITIGLVHLSGVRAVIDGVFIDTPAGLFEVAEACSGVKFLIAMIAFGVLVANACFISRRRRAIFLAVCIVVPILANGVRAWATIFAAQYFGVEAATGFDHIVYGWFFFAAVLAVVLAAAWRHFDRPVDDAIIAADRLQASPLLARASRMRLSGGALVAGLATISLLALAWTRAAESLSAELPGRIFLPEVPGWQRVDYRPRVWWEPRATGADHRLLGRYADRSGREVDVFFALYSAQSDGREAGGFGEGALPTEGDWAWLAPGPPAPDAASERLLAEGRFERLAQTSYRTGGLVTGSNARLKLANMLDRLLLRERPTMMLILSAEERPGRPAATAIASFRQSLGPPDRWMDRVAGLR